MLGIVLAVDIDASSSALALANKSRRPSVSRAQPMIQAMMASFAHTALTSNALPAGRAGPQGSSSSSTRFLFAARGTGGASSGDLAGFHDALAVYCLCASVHTMVPAACGPWGSWQRAAASSPGRGRCRYSRAGCLTTSRPSLALRRAGGRYLNPAANACPFSSAWSSGPATLMGIMVYPGGMHKALS